MTKQRRIGLWFAGTSAIFFTRALLYSTFVSRGPEVQDALHLNTAEMGMLSMLYPAGGLAGILFSSWLVNRFGSRIINAATYSLAGIAFIALGPAVAAGDVLMSSAMLFLVGLPMAISDFVGNIEGSAVDNASKRSIFPVIHGSFGVGMLLGATLAGWLINSGVSLEASFAMVGVFIGVLSILAGFTFSKHERVVVTAAAKKINRENSIKVWFEKRSLLIAVIGFSFIMAEGSAGTWVPIALTQAGFTGAEAAFAFGIFWIVITLGRLLGGVVVDRIGRHLSILWSAIFTAAGILVFMGGDIINMPYLGLVLWGLGMAVGFPMSVAAMGDEPAMASARINMIISIVYLSGITIGPALGALGEAMGIYVAFGIPLAMMLVTAAISGATKPLPGSGKK
ncbi:MFS transporter [Rhodoluna sp.]|jgi:MFS family permease|uniref:MFS transporter n=1 Tax=Rhodoluna sp. TaxID=1969481 RepID=UPI0025E4099D|nr:MFS transporter [Rhodoluna sp.]